MTISSDKIEDFIKALNRGKVCIFRTDTVVGLGTSLYINNNHKLQVNKDSYKRLFEIKQRPLNKKIPWLISSYEMCESYCKQISRKYRKLIKEKWPGNTSFILDVNNDIPFDFCVTNKDQKNIKKTVAFRMPNIDPLRNCIETHGYPVCCTSANLSDDVEASNLNEVNPYILDQADFIFEDNGPTFISHKASKIIDCTNDELTVLRR